ncbi:predicted protein [Histoplasma capsulatum var. duboisii H88]|uniref:Predicted protein n=2 Tax=Ajellomyces capsulatus TaxID=5037 RepID=F0U814_AJEC8|nr:predicted protein [Histoplasma capsulatum H143]EGC40836.1 predicted protein [Histoplasma capsulatum var. duboisii H88]
MGHDETMGSDDKTRWGVVFRNPLAALLGRLIRALLNRAFFLAYIPYIIAIQNQLAAQPASQPKQKGELLSSKERPKNRQASTAAGSVTGCFFHDPARSVRFKDCTVSKL